MGWGVVFGSIIMIEAFIDTIINITIRVAIEQMAGE
jgi:hypothetical protein